jgi:hypothetical protein
MTVLKSEASLGDDRRYEGKQQRRFSLGPGRSRADIESYPEDGR